MAAILHSCSLVRTDGSMPVGGRLKDIRRVRVPDGVHLSWPNWRAHMARKPVHAPPIVEMRRRGSRRRLKQLRTAVMVIAAIVIPMLGLLYFGPMP